MNRLFDNPVLVKHVRSRLRRQHVAPLIIVVVVVSLFLIWAGHELGGLENGVIFSIILSLQGVSLLLAGTNQVAQSVALAKESGILDFHRVSPLPAADQTVGFLLGGAVREYVAAACLFPFGMYCAVLGPPGPLGYLVLLGVLLSSTLLFHTLGMVGALMAPRRRGAGGGAVILIVVSHFAAPAAFEGMGLPGLLTVIPAYTEIMANVRGWPVGNAPTFFGLELPVAGQSLIYQLPLLAFLFVAAKRRMHAEGAHLYSKSTAVAFLTTIAVLAMGGLVEHPGLQTDVAVAVVLYAVVIAALVLTLAVTPTLGQFSNGLRRAVKMQMQRPPQWADLSSNHGAVLVFCGVVLSAARVAWHFLAGAQAPAGEQFWMMAATAVLVVAYFGFAAQFFQLAFGRRSLAWFFVFLFLAWIVPVLVGLVIAMPFRQAAEHVLSLSPIVGIAMARPAGVALSLAFALLFGILLARVLRRAEATVRASAAPPDGVF